MPKLDYFPLFPFYPTSKETPSSTLNPQEFQGNHLPKDIIRHGKLILRLSVTERSSLVPSPCVLFPVFLLFLPLILPAPHPCFLTFDTYLTPGWADSAHWTDKKNIQRSKKKKKRTVFWWVNELHQLNEYESQPKGESGSCRRECEEQGRLTLFTVESDQKSSVCLH